MSQPARLTTITRRLKPKPSRPGPTFSDPLSSSPMRDGLVSSNTEATSAPSRRHITSSTINKRALQEQIRKCTFVILIMYRAMHANRGLIGIPTHSGGSDPQRLGYGRCTTNINHGDRRGRWIHLNSDHCDRSLPRSSRLSLYLERLGHCRELGQMENNDIKLKELATPNV
ncbi:hypothetical protein CR513_23918, partial [Mucuna pruriens]